MLTATWRSWYTEGHMNPRTFIIGVLQLALAGVVLLLSHYNYTGIAAALVLIPAGVVWARSGRSWEALLLASPSAIIGLSVVVLVGLNGQPVFPVLSQIVITLAYAVWLVWLRQLRLHKQSSLAVLAVQQLAATTAIFLAAASWHWPISVAVPLIWAAMTGTTLWYLRIIGEQAAAILAVSWGLIAAEIAWVLSAWQVIYVIGGGAILIPQATLVLLGVGYCFASIYQSHSERRLSRRRLIEYVAIAAVLLAVVIAGTRWNGTS
jgi:hypothetical protein